MPASADTRAAGSISQVPYFVVLSGPRRGHSEVLEQQTYHIVMGADEAVRIMVPDGESIEEIQATLHQAADSYELEVAAGHSIWVNGEQVQAHRKLRPGDLLEIGQGGPMVRYRFCPPGAIPRKTFAEAVLDSFDGAQADGRSQLGKITAFVVNIVQDLVTQTTLWFRIWVVIILTLLVISMVILVAQYLRLQKQVTMEQERIGTMEQKLSQQDIDSLSIQDLLLLKAEVNTRLADTFARLDEIEAARGEISRVISMAAPSVAFLLGSYGFKDITTGQYLHAVEQGEGITRYTLAEEGRIVELVFTGTGFVVSAAGALITNQHVMRPWEGDPRADIAQGRNLIPEILRVVAYYPGVSEPSALSVIKAHDQHDLVILSAGEVEPVAAAPLLFEGRTPQPGDEIIVLGYPTGMRALVARASPAFLEQISVNGRANFWTMAQRLSEAGYIEPLASRGIVSQVTEEFVVYDAETTFGGSGGPVLGLNGKVIAINAAILPEFGGSNMGIPAHRAEAFLAPEVKHHGGSPHQ